MSRRPSVLLLVLAVGLAAVLLTACGGGGVRGGLPESNAQALEKEIGDVEDFVNRGDCDDLDGQLRQVDEEIDNLPESVSDALVQNLQQGAERLRTVALEDCNEQETETTETQTETEPEPTVTEPIPTTTEPAEPPAETTPQTPTTPPPLPEPAPEPQPEPDGGPDPGQGEGDGTGGAAPGSGASAAPREPRAARAKARKKPKERDRG